MMEPSLTPYPKTEHKVLSDANQNLQICACDLCYINLLINETYNSIMKLKM